MNVYPYFNADINMTIESRQDEEYVEAVMLMSHDQLRKLHRDLEAEDIIQPGFRRSRRCRLACRAMAARLQRLPMGGSRFGGTSIISGILAFMFGWVITDHFVGDDSVVVHDEGDHVIDK